MSDLRERVARAIRAELENHGVLLSPWEGLEDKAKAHWLDQADAALTVALEEAARVAEEAAPVSQDMASTEIADRCEYIAAAIRALIPKAPESPEQA